MINMYGLTVGQPYAEMLVRGWKPVENRSRPWWSLRGELVAVHAGISRAWIDDASWTLLSRAQDRACVPRHERIMPSDLAFGAFVGVVKIKIVESAAASLGRFKDDPEALLHVGGPYCMVVERAWRLTTPIPAKGKQGPFLLDENDARKVLDGVGLLERVAGVMGGRVA